MKWIERYSATQNVGTVFMDGIVDYVVSPGLSQPTPQPLSDRFVTNITQLSPAGVVDGTEAEVEVTGL